MSAARSRKFSYTAGAEIGPYLVILEVMNNHEPRVRNRSYRVRCKQCGDEMTLGHRALETRVTHGLKTPCLACGNALAAKRLGRPFGAVARAEPDLPDDDDEPAVTRPVPSAAYLIAIHERAMARVRARVAA
jgi:ribosomal protein S27E